MKPSLTSFVATLVVTLFSFNALGQQLKNWPVYSSNAGTKQLSNLHDNGSPPYAYSPALPVYPTIPGGPGVKVMCSNAYFDVAGNLVFYVVQTNESGSSGGVYGVDCSMLYKTYFYNASGVLLPNCAPYPGCTPSTAYTYAPATSEINIIPLPGCGENTFHIIIGNHLMVLDMRNDQNGAVKGITHQSRITTDAGINSALVPGTTNYHRHTPTAVWVAGDGTYFVYFISENTGAFSHARLNKIHVSMNLCEKRNCKERATGTYSETPFTIGISSIEIAGISLFPTPLGFNGTMMSELELSVDGKHILFNDVSTICSINFNDPNDPDLNHSIASTNALRQFAIPLISGSAYMISGLEFSQDAQFIYYAVYDLAQPGALPSHLPGIYQIDLNAVPPTNPTTPIGNSSLFARSQLETGMDNNIYALGEDHIGYIDVAGLNILSYLSVYPDQVLLSPSTMTTSATDEHSLYILPDQLDGWTYDPDAFPVHHLDFCKNIGQGLELTPLLGCGDDANNVQWIKFLSPTFPIFEGTAPTYTVAPYQVDDYDGFIIEAHYTDENGCTKKERFEIYRPPYTTQIVDAHVCYGGSYTMNNPCEGESAFWYNGEIDPYSSNTPIPDIPYNNNYSLSNITSNTTITCVCRDSETGCVISKKVFRITVSPPTLVSATLVYLCEGDIIDLSPYYTNCISNEAIAILPAVPGTTIYPIHCIDAYGCITERREIVAQVTSKTIQEHTITIPCGTLVDLSNYGCSEQPAQWYYLPPEGQGEPQELASTYIVISSPGTYFTSGKNPCCEYTLHVELEPSYMNINVPAVCAGTLLDPAAYLPEPCRSQFQTGPAPMLSSNTFYFTCTESNGCPTNYTVNVFVIPVDPIQNTITVNCGDWVDLNQYNCSGGGTNEWFVKDPETGAILNAGALGFNAAEPITYYCKGTNPCCSLELQIEVIYPELFITMEACAGSPIDFQSHLPPGCEAGETVIATSSQEYTITCTSENGCITLYHFNVTVITPQVSELTFPYHCGDVVSLSEYSCGPDMQWFMEHPVTHTAVPFNYTTFVITHSMTFWGKGTNPCCSVVVHLIVPEPPLEQTIPITVCEGELVSMSSYLPEDCQLTDQPDPAFFPTSGIYRIACYEESGCIRAYIDLNVTVKPKTGNTINISRCPGIFDPATLNGFSPCEGPLTWFMLMENELIPVPELFDLTGAITLTGFSTDHCCSLVVNVTLLPPPPPLVLDICFPDMAPLPFVCAGAVWTKNGQPHTLGYFDEPGAEYEVKCIDEQTGCATIDIIFRTTSIGCEVIFRCFDELLSIDCPPGSTAHWTKNGLPYPDDGAGNCLPDGPGVYIVTCENPDGSVVSTRTYLVIPCEDDESFGKTGTHLAVHDTHTQIPEFTVYPNPTSDQVMVELARGKSDRLEITDMLGKIVYRSKLAATTQKLQIDCGELNNGVYFIKAYSGASLLHTEKIIKIR